MKYALAILVTFLIGCGSQHDSEFKRVCQELEVQPHAAASLQDFRSHRTGDNKAQFDILRAFCMRRQLSAPRDKHPELVDPILNTNSITVLFGPPDARTDDGAWLYYFNQEKTWHLEMSFRDGNLFYTSYRQLNPENE